MAMHLETAPSCRPSMNCSPETRQRVPISLRCDLRPHRLPLVTLAYGKPNLACTDDAGKSRKKEEKAAGSWTAASLALGLGSVAIWPFDLVSNDPRTAKCSHCQSNEGWDGMGSSNEVTSRKDSLLLDAVVTGSSSPYRKTA